MSSGKIFIEAKEGLLKLRRKRETKKTLLAEGSRERHKLAS